MRGGAKWKQSRIILIRQFQKTLEIILLDNIPSKKFGKITIIMFIVLSGLSRVNGLCTKDKGCNVNEDSGLALAYTIAHEIGHK